MVETGRLRFLADGAATRFPDGPLAVALSGGADSAVAAWLALRAGLAVRAIHVHHGLTGSDRLQAAAVDIAKVILLDLTVVRVELERDSEGEARSKRYAALDEEREEAEWLVTGHSADDQAETVMMNLLRSSGADGLSGMQAERWPLARPLLAVWRSEIREIAALAGLPFVDDPANEDLRHLRNRIRSSLFPEIEGAFNASFRESLVRTSEVLSADVALLNRLGSHLRVETRPGAARFIASELKAADPAIATRVLRKGMTAARPPYPPSAQDVVSVLAVAGGEARRQTVAGDGMAERRGPWLVVSWAHEDSSPAPVDLEVPGLTAFGRFEFAVTVGEVRQVRPLSLWSLVLELGAPLRVSAADEGGTIAGKAVEDALAEAKVPAPIRKAWPVVRRNDEVVWIPGVRRVGWPGTGQGRYLCAVATEENGWARFEL